MLNNISLNQYPVLISANSTLNKFLLTTGAAVLMAISANVSIPLQPVPFTFQSIMVLLVGATLGRKLGVLAILQTIVMGLAGLPVFANFSNTYMAFASPSAGYIIGFIAAAYIAGWAAEKGLDRKIFTALVLFGIAHQSIFVFGVGYLAYYLGGDLQKAFNLGYLPFLGWDIIKFCSAVAIMKLLWMHKEARNK